MLMQLLFGLFALVDILVVAAISEMAVATLGMESEDAKVFAVVLFVLLYINFAIGILFGYKIRHV